MIFECGACNGPTKNIDIQAGDWIDVSSSSIGADPNWGWSVEVVEVDEFNAIWCNVWNGTTYELSTFDPYWILDNYRKVPAEE